MKWHTIRRLCRDPCFISRTVDRVSTEIFKPCPGAHHTLSVKFVGIYQLCRYISNPALDFFVKGSAAEATDAPHSSGLLCNPVMKMTTVFFFICQSHGAPVEWNWQGKTEVVEEKPVPVPLCPPQISQGLTRDRTRSLRGERPATNRLCHGTALVCRLHKKVLFSVVERIAWGLSVKIHIYIKQIF
jgi:hypothetical protein